MTKIQKQAGFTLIEILVVIGIIAILATIVLIAINPARQFKQARDTQRTSNVNAILNAIGQYIADNKGTIPLSITAIDQDISNGAANLCTNLVPKYLPALPFDPSATITDCTSGTYDTKYNVKKDSSSDRITVSAPFGELASISVTR
ncbi:MAG: type II secretion system protein [Candidatus Daviesbacteria bacterium]|nr:type II secretion system protein [Candidatus Daviesbacteria bacterium]